MSHFEHDSHLCTRAEVLQVLRRQGLPPQTIAEISAQLSDPVDLHDAAQLLQSYGVTRDELISRMGGSP